MTSSVRLRTTATCAFAAAIFGSAGANAAPQGDGGWEPLPSDQPAESGVVRVIVHPWLGGKSPLVAVRAPESWRSVGTVISLRNIESAIPNPLPAPLPQPICRGIAIRVTLITRDGQRLTYGPCAFPDSILPLRRAMYRVAVRNATREAVVSIVVDRSPQGKSPLVAARAPRSWRGRGMVISLRSIERAIPHPLPLPLPQRNCRRTATITVTTRSEHHFIYGPCVVPESVKRTKSAMFRVASRNH
jgi:hypothetical protein